MDEHHWTVTYWKCLMLAYCPETQTMSECMAQYQMSNPLYKHVCTQMFLKMHHFEIQFFGFFFFFFKVATYSPSISTVAIWARQSGRMRAGYTPLLCNLSRLVAWQLWSDCLPQFYWCVTGGKHKTWRVCCIYMCSGWFCKQLMNSETGWPW